MFINLLNIYKAKNNNESIKKINISNRPIGTPRNDLRTSPVRLNSNKSKKEEQLFKEEVMFLFSYGTNFFATNHKETNYSNYSKFNTYKAGISYSKSVYGWLNLGGTLKYAQKESNLTFNSINAKSLGSFELSAFSQAYIFKSKYFSSFIQAGVGYSANIVEYKQYKLKNQLISITNSASKDIGSVGSKGLNLSVFNLFESLSIENIAPEMYVYLNDNLSNTSISYQYLINKGNYDALNKTLNKPGDTNPNLTNSIKLNQDTLDTGVVGVFGNNYLCSLGLNKKTTINVADNTASTSNPAYIDNSFSYQDTDNLTSYFVLQKKQINAPENIIAVIDAKNGIQSVYNEKDGILNCNYNFFTVSVYSPIAFLGDVEILQKVISDNLILANKKLVDENNITIEEVRNQVVLHALIYNAGLGFNIHFNDSLGIQTTILYNGSTQYGNKNATNIDNLGRTNNITFIDNSISFQSGLFFRF